MIREKILRSTIITKVLLSFIIIFPFIADKVFSQERRSEPRDPKVREEELAALPANGPYFPVDERIIEDRWMIERFVVPLRRHENNPIMMKDSPLEGTGPMAGGTVLQRHILCLQRNEIKIIYYRENKFTSKDDSFKENTR